MSYYPRLRWRVLGRLFRERGWGRRLVLADGRVLRQYAAPELDQLAGNMLDALHRYILTMLAERLP